MKFDKVIMNPPYKEGNLIWRISKKKSNIIVSLMPLTRYKGGKIYEYIQDFTFIENNFDAYVAKNNCITISQKNRNNNQKYLDLLFHTFDENSKIEFFTTFLRKIYIFTKKFFSVS